VTLIKRVSPALFTAILIALFAHPAAAQNSVTGDDVQRLQDTIADVSREVAQLQDRDSGLSRRLQSELDTARDDATYLRVKIRRNESIDPNEYGDLRDRVESIRRRARGETNDATMAPEPSRRAQNPNEVPVGTEFDVRLQSTLTSATAQVEDRFEGTTMVDLVQGDRVLVPAGSVMRGVVSSVTKATRTERKGAITVAFDRVTIKGRAFPIRATVTQALESEGIKGEKEKIGAGAGVGAIIGGILGGFKGALAGILIGGGGTIAATEGKDVELPPGTVLRVRLDTALVVR
jgi:hypothetical protein